MQRKIVKPPRPYVVYFEDMDTDTKVHLPIRSSKDASLQLHPVSAYKLSGPNVQAGAGGVDNETRMAILIVLFLIEGT